MESMIPPDWLDAWREWAPLILAALVATTALVHALLPIARRLERWAAVSPIGWDDGPARSLVGALEWISKASAWLLSVLPRVAVGARAPKSPRARPRAWHEPPVRPEKPGTLVEPSEPYPPAPPDPPRSGGALGLLLFATALSAAASGCGASALQVRVQVAAGFEDSARETGQVVRTVRTDAMREAARAVHDAGGTEVDAIAAAKARGLELAPLVEAQRLYALATHGYVDALWIAEHAAGGFNVELVRPALLDLLDAYRHLRRIGAALGVPELAGLPETPAWLDGLLPPQLLDQEGGAR